MIHTPENCKDKILVDCLGTEVPNVLSFDDETFEVELALTGKSKIKSPNPNGKLIIVQPKVADLDGCCPVGKFQTVVIKTKIFGARLISKQEHYELDYNPDDQKG